MTNRSKAPIYFHFDNTAFSLRNRNKLKHFIVQILTIEKKKLGGLSYVFSTDRQVLKINRKFLNHDFYTDVITFDLSNTTTAVEGEIYISIDRVKQNAKNYNAPFSEELHRVIFHAVLHLCGYDDKTTDDRAVMKKKENRYLARYFNSFT
jgi:probable rRNA maturation factor